MFDKLEELVAKLEEIMKELSDPDVVNDQQRFKKLMKEQSDITPVVEKYNEYKKAKQDEEQRKYEERKRKREEKEAKRKEQYNY